MTLPLGGQVPKDVLQVSNLGTSTQNLNPSKMTNAAKGRMYQSFLGTGAGLPGGVATTATNLFGQFAGKIADDNDATTVENPADVNAQVTSFFGNPGTSILDLIFGALISALGSIPIIGGAIQSLAVHKQSRTGCAPTGQCKVSNALLKKSSVPKLPDLGVM